MARVFLSIGSNLDDRLSFLQQAVDALCQVPGFRIKSVSSVYDTEPVGKKDQPRFLNAALEVESALSPDSLIVNLKRIESLVGRTPSVKWGPREIDIDLIYVGELLMSSPLLTLPHPEAQHRRFVLTPLAEIAPDFVDPKNNETLRTLLAHCADPCEVTKSSLKIHCSAVEN